MKKEFFYNLNIIFFEETILGIFLVPDVFLKFIAYKVRFDPMVLIRW